MSEKIKEKKQKGRSVGSFMPVSQGAPFQYQEAYKSLRTNLNFASMDGGNRKIVITSSIPSEGKSSVAINLAVSIAETDKKVILLDCDFRKPALLRYLGVEKHEAKGVTDILAKPELLESAIVRFSDIGIHFLSSGIIPPNPAELLGGHRMKELVEKLSGMYDYVIFDTPPVSVVTDAAVLSHYADGVIFVVRQKCATIEQAKLAKRNLEAVNANVIGAVLNVYDSKSSDRDGYYSYDYYGHDR